ANHPAGARAFEHGGEFHTPPGKGAAYVATGAIGLACLLSLIGFVKFTSEAAAVHEEHAGVIHQGGHEHGKEPSKKDKEKQAKKRAAAHSDLQDFEERWSGRMRPDWAVVRPASLGDSDKGTVLQLGYHIDHLTAAMFLMVTFVATLIHVSSIGYMGEEVQSVVEDHQVHTEESHLRRRRPCGRLSQLMALVCFSI